MPPPVFSNWLDRAALDQAAARRRIGNHHNAPRIQHLGGFRHEPHTAERDDVAAKLPCFAGQLQAVAHAIGQLLNFALLIMMRQQNGFALPLELKDLVGDSGRGSNHGC